MPPIVWVPLYGAGQRPTPSACLSPGVEADPESGSQGRQRHLPAALQPAPCPVQDIQKRFPNKRRRPSAVARAGLRLRHSLPKCQAAQGRRAQVRQPAQKCASPGSSPGSRSSRNPRATALPEHELRTGRRRRPTKFASRLWQPGEGPPLAAPRTSTAEGGLSGRKRPSSQSLEALPHEHY